MIPNNTTMFTPKFIKLEPNQYGLKYKKGEVVQEGYGISFFYNAPTTSIAIVPTQSSNVPFVYTETTSDFQQINIQGDITFQITDPKKIIDFINFTIDSYSQRYITPDPSKLPDRIINITKVILKKEIETLNLKKSLKNTDILVDVVIERLEKNKELNILGINILGLSIIAITPVQETSRALEAQTREEILKEADNALYDRRDSSVNQERKIKENEINTEIAMENKKKQVKEAEMNVEKLIQERKHMLKDDEMTFNIKFEERRKELVASFAENEKVISESKAYAIASVMKAFDQIDPRTIQALATVGMKPDQLIALSFQEIGKNAEKIGQLNITPDLLQDLIHNKNDR